MPGSRFSWKYNKQLEAEAKYDNENINKDFLR